VSTIDTCRCFPSAAPGPLLPQIQNGSSLSWDLLLSFVARRCVLFFSVAISMSETKVLHLLALGDSFHVDENYESALQSYNDAWSAAITTKEEDCSRIPYLQFQILSHRANVNLLIGNTQDAYNDMSLAKAYLPSVEITPFETFIAYKRLGISLYQLGRHDKAKGRNTNSNWHYKTFAKNHDENVVNGSTKCQK